jgi:hypothetical protein
MRSLLAVSLVALLVGCATATAPGVGGDDDDDDDDDVHTDARLGPDARLIDAQLIDAPPSTQTITLSQTGSQVVEPASSIACAENDGAGGIVATRENSYYRVFRLADFGVNRPFTPTMVTFGVEQATSLGGTQPVQVKLYTLSGALSTANLTPIAGNNTVLADSAVTSVNVTISPAPVVQPSATLVVEVFSPDGDPDLLGFGNQFFIGTNRQTETATGYLRSATCGVTQPTAYGALGDPTFATIRLVLTVTGTY